MMTRMMTVAAVVGSLLLASGAEAQMIKPYKWFKHKSAKYKIQVCLNTGMKVKARKMGKWGILAAKQGTGLGKVGILIAAYTGPAKFVELQQAALKITKIPNKFWKKTRAKAAWNGFGRNETYLAQQSKKKGPGRKIVIAFLAKHGKYVDRNYVVLVQTTAHNFLKRQKAFKAWGNCLRALP